MNPDRIRNILADCKASDELVAVHVNRDDPEGFDVGWVSTLGSDEFQLRLINSQALVDGTLVTKYSHVLRIHRASPYLNMLNNWTTSGHPTEGIAPEFATIEESLGSVKREGRIVKLELSCSTFMTGFIVHFEGSTVELQHVDEAARPAGRFYFDVSEIESIAIGQSALLALEYAHGIRMTSSKE